MKRLLPLAVALSVACTAAFSGGLADAQAERIVETVPTTAAGQTTSIGGATYVAIALGVLVLAAVAADDSGSSTSGTEED